jgi:hypothetical protein
LEAIRFADRFDFDALVLTGVHFRVLIEKNLHDILRNVPDAYYDWRDCNGRTRSGPR